MSEDHEERLSTPSILENNNKHMMDSDISPLTSIGKEQNNSPLMENSCVPSPIASRLGEQDEANNVPKEHCPIPTPAASRKNTDHNEDPTREDLLKTRSVPSIVPKLSLSNLKQHTSSPALRPSSASKGLNRSIEKQNSDRINRNISQSPSLDSCKRPLTNRSKQSASPVTPTRKSLTVFSPKICSSASSLLSTNRRSQSRERIAKLFTPPSSKGFSSAFSDLTDFVEINRNLESMGMKFVDYGEKKSLENFDEHSKEKILLTSPRSIEACLRTGIAPTELIYKDESEFYSKGATTDIVKMRWTHYESRRKEKLQSVREERHKIAIEDADAGDCILNGDNTVVDETFGVLLEEQKKYEQQFNNNKSYVEHLINYEIESKRKQQEKEKKLKLREEKIEMEKQKRMERQQEIIRKRDQNDFERQQELEKQRNDRRAKEIERQKEVEERENARTRQVEDRFRELQVKTDFLKMRKTEKIKQTLMRDEELQKAKEQSLLEKQENFEKKIKDIEMLKEKTIRQTKEIALLKDMKIRETKMKSDRIEQARVSKVLDKLNSNEDQLKKFEHEKSLLMQKKKIEEQNKELHRMDVIQKSKEEMEKKVEKIILKQQKDEMMNAEMIEKARSEALRKLEEQRLKEIDKQENVERAKRVEQFKKLQTMTLIEDKKKKVDLIEQAKQELQEKKHLQKTLLKRSRQLLQRVVNPDSVNAEEIIETIISPRSRK
ncbi:hypothetical protein C9374_003295 [Naegleria lovaniensis]|uniref:Uncharacterized protein n=1 Tax=Naegleria lovaniensis TaxID=51637 RepID=A0AA88KJC3_NAELO|nr:uncharacterized protein C9374_003295 [Naegleria lovaniensis]KAG2385480.1 hypothetical protein C9374_003295 [Naegleria lovaniensis]